MEGEDGCVLNMPKREVSYCHLYFPLLLKYYKPDEGVIRIFKTARAVETSVKKCKFILKKAVDLARNQCKIARKIEE